MKKLLDSAIVYPVWAILVGRVFLQKQVSNLGHG